MKEQLRAQVRQGAGRPSVHGSLQHTAVRSVRDDGALSEVLLGLSPAAHEGLSPATHGGLSPATHGGLSLQSDTRAVMESRFGYDFSQVRVHTDAQAAESARAVQAKAYTVGQDLVFAAGYYAPHTAEGQRLIAHELAHVVQQGRGGDREPQAAGSSAQEQDAHAAAQSISTGASRVMVRSSAPIGMARDPDNKPLRQPSGTPAMTPEDMYNKLLAERGFEQHIPVHELQNVEKQLQDMRDKLQKQPDPALQRQYNTLLNRYNLSRMQGQGAPAGAGYNTYAIVQVVDKDGNIVAVATGKYIGGKHAEELALDKLEAELGTRQLPGGRIDVVGDKVICGQRCRPALRDFAVKHDLDHVEGYVFRRPRLTGTGEASEKTTARTATTRATEGRTPTRQAETVYRKGGSGGGGGESGPPTTGSRGGARSGAATAEPSVEGQAGAARRTGTPGAEEGEPEQGLRRPGRVTGGLGESGGEVPPSPKTAVVGSLAHLGAGLALNLFQEEFKEKMLKDLANLPKPKVDKRGASEFFADPKSARSMQLIDLFNKNLKPFQKELDDNHTLTITTANLEIMAVALMSVKTSADEEKRFERLDAIADQLQIYENQLLTVRDNLDALLKLEAKAMETKKAADDLRSLLKSGIVIDWLFRSGFSVEEIATMDSNLLHLSVSIDSLFRDAHALDDDIDRLLKEEMEMAHNVNKIWWTEFGEQFRLHVKELRAKEAAEARARAAQAAAAAPPPAAPVGLNPDQLGIFYKLRTDESQILYQLNQIDQKAATANTQELAKLNQQRRDLLDRLKQVRDELKPYGETSALH